MRPVNRKSLKKCFMFTFHKFAYFQNNHVTFSSRPFFKKQSRDRSLSFFQKNNHVTARCDLFLLFFTWKLRKIALPIAHEIEFFFRLHFFSFDKIGKTFSSVPVYLRTYRAPHFKLKAKHPEPQRKSKSKRKKHQTTKKRKKKQKPRAQSATRDFPRSLDFFCFLLELETARDLFYVIFFTLFRLARLLFGFFCCLARHSVPVLHCVLRFLVSCVLSVRFAIFCLLRFGRPCCDCCDF